MEFFFGIDHLNTQEEAEDPAKEPPKNCWTEIWPIEYDRFPTLIKLHITQGASDQYMMAFFNRNKIKMIIYEKA
jgi:hypothetical protein